MNMADFAKNLSLSVMLAAAVLVFAGRTAHALGVDDRTPPTHKVSETKHNLSTSSIGALRSTDETEICIFCHTPHNAALNVPLWNHYSTDTAKTFVIYSSYNFSKIMGGSLPSMIDSNSVSLLCLTCHDGTTALNALVNFGASGTRPDWEPLEISFSATGVWGPGEGPYLGTDLTNMHPINFSYDDARSGDPAGLYARAIPEGEGLKFFNVSPGKTNSLECPTCHDPHVYTGYEAAGSWDGNQQVNAPGNYPFLRRSNTSSALCLSCHDK